jgi:GTP pyrophosphokinase
MPTTSTDTATAERVPPRLRPRRLGGRRPDSTDIGELLDIHREHHPGASTAEITAAFSLAEIAHSGATRRSGDPYITHPVEVAEITADLGMDTVSVCAALLHDVVEDTDITLDDVHALFSDGFAGDGDFADAVVRCVDGLTKIDGLHYDTEGGHRAAELRRFLLAVAGDPRVLVVKLADRLHNMRTISALPAAKQRRIATETLEVFAPLAHRLGMSAIRNELEDLCFATLWPQRYAELARLVAERHAGVHDEIGEAVENLAAELHSHGIAAEVSWRVKHLWGIHSKMERRGRSFDEIHDVIGIRVIVDTTADCYAAVGVCHQLWTPSPGSFRDMIASPLFNAYQSLHTTVRGPHGRAIEVQVRTTDMHTTAEYGLAAHWAYKEADGVAAAVEIAEVTWMRRLLEAAASGETVDDVTGELRHDEIYTFTPGGRVIALPAGATPVDFAYQVHTEVGDRVVGAKVNAKMVALDHRLNGGETVEIITSGDAGRGPNPEWARWVATPRARALIRRWHTRARRAEMADAGHRDIRAAVDRRAAGTGTAAPDDSALRRALEQVTRAFGVNDVDVLASQVGDRRISAEAVAARIVATPAAPQRRWVPDQGWRRDVLVSGAAGVDVHFAACCAPEPIDPIIGWVTTGRGVSVHRTDCTNVGALLEREPGRSVDVTWIDMVDRDDVAVELRIESIDRTGLFADCSAVLGAHGADIRSVSGDTSGTFGVQRYRIRVADDATVEAIVAALWALDGVCDISVHAPKAG